MRDIIIHYHIFKNAGSTLYRLLKKNFGKCGSIEGTNPWDTLSPDDILKYAIDNPSLKAITSHHARLPLPDHPDLVFHPLIFLRHPIDRVGSVYSYERSLPESSNNPNPAIEIAHNNDLAGYVKWRLLDGHGAVIKNFQTVHLSGRQRDMRTATATEDDLKVALERLSELPFFGIVELFDESIAKLSCNLFPYFPQFDINYVSTNISAERKISLQERLDDTESRLGRNLYQELLDKNAIDIQLYDQALSLFSLNSVE
jgi:hypothetical protein